MWILITFFDSSLNTASFFTNSSLPGDLSPKAYLSPPCNMEKAQKHSSSSFFKNRQDEKNFTATALCPPLLYLAIKIQEIKVILLSKDRH